MNTALEKLKRLEQLLSKDNGGSDPVVEQTLDKLLDYEKQNMVKLKNELLAECKAFENHYSMPSNEFLPQFEGGKLGDAMDFIEWASTIDMLKRTEQRIKILEANDS